ncbi:zinc metalloprotease [Desulfonema ishimotonii]|uniref:Zinc metalloprotease n=1 Tax=Desulfonema ishimotonii TaxID=45657 RepID=A0A401FQR8_9BACT|nr:RIP metalloprotease RseP [Desulfonema ishimotonii]GBC59302.1 zinc metalloprotease [Desulfonema ishimotonii]
MTSFFAFIVVLGVLVFFHELGHFLVARLCGVGVEVFSLGFGPRLIGRTVGRTDYRISGIPLGGFVKMVGEEPDADIPEADIPVSFTHKPVHKRMLIVAAGPLFNFLLTLIIFFGLFRVSGVFVSQALVGDVKKDSPAYVAGLQKDDRIVAIDGTAVETWDDMAEIISGCGGRELAVSVQRDGAVRVRRIVPEAIESTNIFGEKISRYVIGITSSSERSHRRLNTVQALGESFRQTYEITRLTVVSIGKMVQGRISVKENLGGPIVIAQMSGQMAERGTADLIFWIALLSVSLGILNLFPIPVLDGGHLLFFFIEAVSGHPVNTRVRELAQQAGFFVLLLLMIFVFYNDISRIFASS